MKHDKQPKNVNFEPGGLYIVIADYPVLMWSDEQVLNSNQSRRVPVMVGEVLLYLGVVGQEHCFLVNEKKLYKNRMDYFGGAFAQLI